MNKREARLKFWFTKQDLVHPFPLWPAWAKKTALLEHKGNRERYQLATFLLSNGLPPQHLEQFVLASDINNPSGVVALPTQGNYDAKAYRHLEQIRRQHEDGSLYSTAKEVYDINVGRPLALNTQRP